jgi:hypothetical protein
MKAPLLLVAACVIAWCLFITIVCTGLILEGEIIDEERDLPFDQRPSLTSWNGKAVAHAAYKKHATLFPDSRLRFRYNAAWIAAVLTFLATVFLSSRAFGL